MHMLCDALLVAHPARPQRVAAWCARRRKMSGLRRTAAMDYLSTSFALEVGMLCGRHAVWATMWHFALQRAV